MPLLEKVRLEVGRLMQLLGFVSDSRLSQELRPKVQVFYWYSLNTPCSIVLSKQGYVKVDRYLPRRVVLIVDCIVQESHERSYHTDSRCSCTR